MVKSLSIVYPFYNEEKNARKTLLDTIHTADTLNIDYEIIAVEDGSRDGTLAELEKMRAEYPQIKIVRHAANLGYGPTIKDGLNAGTKDWLFFSDSDGQFDFAEIKKLISFSDKGDLIIGYRNPRRDPPNRIRNAKIFAFAVRLVFGVSVRDIDCAFKLFKRSFFQSLNLASNSAMINTELLYKAKVKGMRPIEVPVTHLERAYGTATGANPLVVLKAMREFPKLTALNFRNIFADRFAFVAGTVTAIMFLLVRPWK